MEGAGSPRNSTAAREWANAIAEWDAERRKAEKRNPRLPREARYRNPDAEWCLLGHRRPRARPAGFTHPPPLPLLRECGRPLLKSTTARRTLFTFLYGEPRSAQSTAPCRRECA